MEEEEDEADAGAEAARPDLMDRFWDSRLRALLRDRFDVREGLFEMDYQLRLVERGGAAVSHREYCHWRKTGEAFAFNEAVDLGNKNVIFLARCIPKFIPRSFFKKNIIFSQTSPQSVTLTLLLHLALLRPSGRRPKDPLRTRRSGRDTGETWSPGRSCHTDSSTPRRCR